MINRRPKNEQQEDSNHHRPYHSSGFIRKARTASFQELLMVHKLIKKNLAHMDIDTMTEVQHKAHRPITDGLDVNILAPEASGKTLAFLVPFLSEKLMVHMIKKGIHCVFLTPDSHNAAANYLFMSDMVQLMGPNITVQAVYDSYSKQREVQRLSKKVPTILIATPSRLRHHLEESVLSKQKSRKSPKRTKTVFATKFTDLTNTLVLDEADVLLRDHADDLEFIRPYLAMGNDSSRHTILLSSKSFPPNAADWMRADASVTIDCSLKAVPTKGLATNSGMDFADAEHVKEKQRLLFKRWRKVAKKRKIDWKERVSVPRPVDE